MAPYDILCCVINSVRMPAPFYQNEYKRIPANILQQVDTACFACLLLQPARSHVALEMRARKRPMPVGNRTAIS